MKGYEFRIEGTTVDVVPVYGAGTIGLEIDGRRITAHLEPTGDGAYRLDGDEGSYTVWIVHRGSRAFVHTEGRVFEIELVNTLEEVIREAERAGGEALLAPMPGTVIRVDVEVGRTVAEGEVLVVIESMKLQTSIAAPHDGVVAEIPFGAGQSFDKGAVLVRLETPVREESPS